MPSCVVTIRNATSPVPVRHVSVTFVFSDGSSSAASSGAINLRQGQSTSLRTSGADQRKCVKNVRAIITVGSKAITKADGAKLCQSELVWRVDATPIGLRPFSTEKELPESEWEDVLEGIEIVPEQQAELPPD